MTDGNHTLSKNLLWKRQHLKLFHIVELYWNRYEDNNQQYDVTVCGQTVETDSNWRCQAVATVLDCLN